MFKRYATFPLLVLALGALLVLAGPASATLSYKLHSSFGGPASTFEPSSVSVDNSSSPARVYVGDSANTVIDKFSATGAYECQITGAGANNPSPPGSECDTNTSLTANPEVPGRLGFIAYGQTAVDSSGNLFYPEAFGAKVDEFNASGAWVTPQITPGGSALFGVALDASGNLYVAADGSGEIYKCESPSYSSCSSFAADQEITGVAVNNDSSSSTSGYVYGAGHGVVEVFDSSGNHKATITGTGPARPFQSVARVAVDPANGHLFVVDQEAKAIDEFDASGNFVFQVPVNGSTPYPFAVAVDASNHYLYVADFNDHVIDVYEPVLLPTVTTSAATEVKETTATLHGEVDPEISEGGTPVESCKFEYVGEAAFHHIQTVATTAAGFNLEFEDRNTEWSAGGNLTSGSTVVVGVTVTFGTPIVGEEVAPGGGIQTGTTITAVEPGTERLTISKPATKSETTTLKGFLPGTTTAGVVQHALEALSTIGTGNVAVGGAAGGPWTVEFTGSLAGATLPLLEGAEGVALSVEGDWAAASPAACEPPASAGSPYATKKAVSAHATGLPPSSNVYWRLTAKNTAGKESQVDGETFTTYGPARISGKPSIARTSSATVKAQINPYGYETTCEVEYLTEAEYQANPPSERFKGAQGTPCAEAIPAGFGNQAASAKLEGLAIATVYHYRFVAHNGATTQGGTTEGADETFSTFGIESFSIETLDEGGHPYTSAGGHPYAMMVKIAFTTTAGESAYRSRSVSANPKTIEVALPPGLIIDPQATPQCEAYQMTESECPPEAQVGNANIYSPTVSGVFTNGNLYNLDPPRGVAGQVGGQFNKLGTVRINGRVRTGSDYGIESDTLALTSDAPIESIEMKLWGVPADASHFHVCRGSSGTRCPATEPLFPFLANPTSCRGALSTTLSVDTWQEPGVFATASEAMAATTGCNALEFEPSLEARPTAAAADSPSGLNVDLKVPQHNEPCEAGPPVRCALAVSDLKNAVVTLPAGLTVDPSSADGLEACSEEQVGYLPGRSAEVGHPQFTPGAAKCPEGSKLGTVEVHTPLLDHPIKGGVYLAAQGANPFGSLIALYIAIDDPQSGVVLKLPGKVALDPATGQLTATFAENPQLPFEEMKLEFFEGSRAALTTPLTCGSYSASTSLTPWSGNQAATPTVAPFTIAQAPGGGACASSEAQAPNAPAFKAGTASPLAGSYSPFVLKLAREDGSQHFSALNVTLPPGLTGKIAGLEQCPQAAIDAARARGHEGEGALELAHPSCPAGSEVGVVHVGAGSGAPLYVGGHAYFAGPYNGAPFSLVIVTPAVAGPFDLGTVVVRAALFVDPSTAQVTVKSDPFPTILDGIPLDIRSIGVEMSRSQFTLNPTNCSVMSVTGQEFSTTGQSAALSDRFQAGGCTTLPFRPSFSASTRGSTSRSNGASLDVKVGSSTGQANIGKVHVSLPKQLPSRLDTLKLACAESVFASNPAACPAGSNVGTATALTPILAKALSGPAYLVSHGGAAFPDLEVVLQGEGITLILDGKTNIQNGITESSFESVPDAPISSFELRLPQGPHSILGAPGGKLCTTALAMPTVLQGQNGAVIRQSTKIAVTGCPKVKALTRAQKLTKALKACRKDKNRRKRAQCEKSARKKFGPLKKAKQKK